MILFHSQVAERSQLGERPCRGRPTKAPSPTLRRASLRPCRSNPARLKDKKSGQLLEAIKLIPWYDLYWLGYVCQEHIFGGY